VGRCRDRTGLIRTRGKRATAQRHGRSVHPAAQWLLSSLFEQREEAVMVVTVWRDIGKSCGSAVGGDPDPGGQTMVGTAPPTPAHGCTSRSPGCQVWLNQGSSGP
jgi:hypothetical protein